MSTYRCMSRPTWMISALQHKSKYKSNSISNFFEKKNQIFWFPCCSTREDLSVDVSITYLGLILTKPGRFFSRHSETRGTDRIQFRQFRTFKNFQISGFPWCSTRKDHSIDVSITNVGHIDEAKVISALRQKTNFEFRTFLKKKSNFRVSMV